MDMQCRLPNSWFVIGIVSLRKSDYLWYQALTEWGKTLSKITNLPQMLQLLTRCQPYPPPRTKFFVELRLNNIKSQSPSRLAPPSPPQESDLLMETLKTFWWTSNLTVSDHTRTPQPELDLVMET